MSSTIDDLTIQYEENGTILVKELDKAVLTKGAWSTLVFRYQQWENSKNAYSADRYTIRRYKKFQGEYKPQSKFNISSLDQAKKIIDILTKWVDEAESEAEVKGETK